MLYVMLIFKKKKKSSYRDVAHNTLSTCDKEWYFKRAFTVRRLTVNALFQVLFCELYYAIGVSKLLNLENEHIVHNCKNVTLLYLQFYPLFSRGYQSLFACWAGRTVSVTDPALGSMPISPERILSTTINFSVTSTSPWGRIFSSMLRTPPSPSLKPNVPFTGSPMSVFTDGKTSFEFGPKICHITWGIEMIQAHVR